MSDLELFTVKEVARYFRVGTRTIYRLIRDQDLPACRVGGQHRIEKEQLELWLASRIENLPDADADERRKVVEIDPRAMRAGEGGTNLSMRNERRRRVGGVEPAASSVGGAGDLRKGKGRAMERNAGRRQSGTK